jgi:hypothetical protein
MTHRLYVFISNVRAFSPGAKVCIELLAVLVKLILAYPVTQFVPRNQNPSQDPVSTS